MKINMGQDTSNVNGFFDEREITIYTRKDLITILDLKKNNSFFVQGGIGVFRHGKTVDNIDGEDKPKSILVELDKKEFTEDGYIISSVKKIQELGFNKKNIHIYTANDTKRINQTLHIICKELGIDFEQDELGEIKNNKYITMDDRFSARKKGKTSIDATIPLNIAGDIDIYGQESLLQAMNRAATGIYDLQQGNSYENKLLLVVGYRTSIGGFEHKLEGKKLEDKTVDANFAQFKLQGLTLQKESLKYNNLYSFCFDIDNYKKELNLWNKEVFGSNQQLDNFPLFDGQNLINFNVEHLEKERKISLFNFILTKNIFTANIKFYALANLIKLQKKNIIISNIKNLLWDKEIKEKLSNIVKVEENKKNSNLAAEILQEIETYEFMEKHYQENILPTVQKIRSKSLDKRVKSGENIDFRFNFNIPEYSNNTFSWVSEDPNIKIIQSKPLLGKSFLLLSLIDFLKTSDFKIDNKRIYPIYMDLSGRTLEEIKNELKVIKNANIYGFDELIILDSLEKSTLYEEEIEDLIEVLESSYKVIITTRESYLEGLFNVEFQKQKKSVMEPLLVFFDEPSEDLIIKEKKGYIKGIYKENLEIIDLVELSNSNLSDFVYNYFKGNNSKVSLFYKVLNVGLEQGLTKIPIIFLLLCQAIDSGLISEDYDIHDVNGLFDAIINILILNFLEENLKKIGGKREKSKRRIDKYIKKLRIIIYNIARDNLIKGQVIDEQYMESIFDEYNLEVENMPIFYKNLKNSNYEFIDLSLKRFIYKLTLEKKVENGDLNFDILNENTILDYSFLAYIESNENSLKDLKILIEKGLYDNNVIALRWILKILSDNGTIVNIPDLEQLMKLDIFKLDRKSIIYFFIAIFRINEVEGFNMIDKIISKIDLNGFLNTWVDLGGHKQLRDFMVYITEYSSFSKEEVKKLHLALFN